MAWKTLSSGGAANWFGESVPLTKTLLTPSQGFMINIPSVTGGVSTLLYTDDTAPHTLIDDNLSDPVVYNSTNYFNITSAGNCPGIKLTYFNSIKYINLYFDSLSATIDPIALYVMSSTDGVNWVPFQSFSITAANITDYSGYYGTVLTLSNILQSQYIAVMASTDFARVSGETHELVNFNALQAYSTDVAFGSNRDNYNQVSTGNKYINTNGFWVLAYEAPKLPTVLSGGSSIPPNPAGLQDGSTYFVIG